MLKLFRFLRPFRAAVAMVMGLAFAQSLANLYLPRLMADIVDHGIVPGDTNQILKIGGLMLLVAIVGTIAAMAGSLFTAKVATGFGRVVRGRIFDRVARFSVHQFDHFSTASLITRTTNDTTQVQQVTLMLLGMAITAPMMAIGGVVLSLSQDAWLARVLIAVIPVLAVVFFLIMRKAVPLFQQMQVKIDRLNLVLDAVPNVNDPVQAEALAEVVGRPWGHVEFQDVTFQYPGAEEPALSGVSFAAKPGEVTAVIGGTGSGKSTLAGLIPRFYDVAGGRVLVDGVDVRDMRQEDLRAKIGFVPQKAVLFSGTIASNISFGFEGATDEEMRRAATVAQAAEFIDRMPDVYRQIAESQASLEEVA